jgi:acetoin utilization protein AcuB
MKERIRDFMTPQPWTVQADDSLTLAREMLDVRGAHHLPVIDGGKIVGIVTARDLEVAHERIGTVADLMRPVRCVSRDTHLSDVIDAMTEEGRDAVVVVGPDHVEGIFTTTDSLRVLSQLLRGRAA